MGCWSAGHIFRIEEREASTFLFSLRRSHKHFQAEWRFHGDGMPGRLLGEEEEEEVEAGGVVLCGRALCHGSSASVGAAAAGGGERFRGQVWNRNRRRWPRGF